MPIDINVPQLIINKLTKDQYSQAHAEGAIVDTELYLITDDDNGANNDDYKNAILLDDGSLKNSSGEDITEDVKAIVSTEPFVITANLLHANGFFTLSNPNITAEQIIAAYNAGREIQLSVFVNDRYETLYFWYGEIVSSSTFSASFAGGGAEASILVGSNGIFTDYSSYSEINVEMIGSTSSTAGKSGLVPAPAAGDEGKFLKGDGTWAEAMPTITGNVGDFVVIGEDGKLTAKTIVAAEGVSF